MKIRAFVKVYRKLYNFHQKTTTLCFVTTVMGFVLGFVIGVMLPIYVFTVNSTPDRYEASSSFLFSSTWNQTDSPLDDNPQQLVSPLGSVANANATYSGSVSILAVILPKERESDKNDKSYYDQIKRQHAVIPGATSSATSSSSKFNFIPLFLKSFIQTNRTKEKLGYSSKTSDVGKDDKSRKKSLDIVLNDGIFWSSEIEKRLPKGFDNDAFDKWRRFVNRSVIVKVEEGCGRMQNRQVSFDDGVKACCRYRQNNDQIQGEIFSFYLARLLGIENLPPSALAIVRGHEWQWDYVRSYIQLAQWSADRPVVLTRFVDKLSPAFIPSVFRNASRRLHPLDLDLALDETRTRRTIPEIVELVQWSDLIVFDYITANLDRVVNNMYNEQWNSEMMKSPAHNLAKSEGTGLLVFLDNESGLLHGYRLLDKYEHYHLSLLRSLCLFKNSTVLALERLRNGRNVALLLKEMFERVSPHMRDWLPFIPDRYLKILSNRIETVYQHVLKCHDQYGSGDIPFKRFQTEKER